MLLDKTSRKIFVCERCDSMEVRVINLQCFGMVREKKSADLPRQNGIKLHPLILLFFFFNEFKIYLLREISSI